MIRRLLLVVLSCGLVFGWATPNAGARSVHPVEMKTLPMAYVDAVATGPAGEVVVVGERHGNMVVVKYARGGARLWTRTLRIKGRLGSRGEDVTVGREGTVYAVGTKEVRGGDREFPDRVTVVLAFGPRGRLHWQRHFHQRAMYSDLPTGIAVSGHVVVVSGFENCFECEYAGGWLHAWSRGGRFLWHDPFEFDGIRRVTNDLPYAIAAGTAGDLFVAGGVSRGVYGWMAPVDEDVFVRRITPDGDTVWTRVFSDAAFDADRAVSVASRGDVVAIGTWLDARPTADPAPAVTVLSTAGEVLWSHPFGKRSWNEVGVDVGPGAAVFAMRTRDPADGLPALVLRKYAHAGTIRWTSVTRQGLRALWGIDLDQVRSVVRVVAQGVGQGGPWTERARLLTYPA